jgi:hypothetical protein
MKTLSTSLRSIIAATAVLASASSQAVLITFDGQVATDGSGLTSQYVPSNNQVDPNDGYYIETFDISTAIAGFPAGDTSYNDGNQPGCAVNTAGAAGISLNTSGSDAFAVRQGTAAYAAAPANDQSCFGFTPAGGGVLPSWTEIDYSGFLTAGVRIDYFGFYWGSVDTYNSFEFYSGEELVATVTGTSLLSELGGTSGDRVGDGSNAYVNLFFDINEAFDRFRVVSTGIAGEFDNVVIGLDNRQQISEPGTLVVFALGLIGLCCGIRRKR